ncbi:beta-ketoacyl-[acyl-carrier-protein] synthase family protein [Montanilutibacter psychrotolerans]|uniref:Beta-ketoacyl-[acyl-carrier-protein] synthase family protein n=1 Tax=Montanilutibacter psychrotolerans TaxID=1327343 RepID=A0A3M8SX70_9GAMM|nr:beta-ketoacyl-[acyl-carrier-protein] synthase family protein [Lysobacter psychrotolerans]RNF85403.1 beta-ketoacyl-[acyl-carrier-protein] synthase family protein [Lysobacter psychrotolerans]
MNAQRVVVTGLGAVTGLGLGWRTLWDGLCAGRSAVRPWSPPGLDGFPVRFAAPVAWEAFADAHRGSSWWETPMERRSRFGMAALDEAVADAGEVLRSHAPSRIGIAIGSGVPERDPADMLLAVGEKGPCWSNLYRRAAELNPDSGLINSNDHLAVLAARHLQVQGPVVHFSTACAGAAHAIGHGFRMIRRGEVDAMIVGGADSVLNLSTMVGLHLLGAPSVSDQFGEALSRPFDRDRSGFVAAEGAALLVLESESTARRRGARVYAEIAGFGSALDAYRITAPHPQGDGAALAMQRALRDASMSPSAIDHVNAHGTSTPLNDPAETLAIKRVFAANGHYRRLAVSSNKSMIGHLIAAAGAPECIATVLAVAQGRVPPTLNLTNPDAQCDLDYVPGNVARAQTVRAAISNSFGFGGLNATIAVRAHPLAEGVSHAS